MRAREVKFRTTGVTLTEILLIVLISGVLAAFAIPRYFDAIERFKGREAYSSLMQIRSAEFVYRSDQGLFWPADTDEATAETDIATINAQLGTCLDLRLTDDWNFSLWAYAGDDDGREFKVKAVRKSGIYSGDGTNRIIVDKGPQVPLSQNWPFPLPSSP